jgi:hypothetical protein
MLARDLYDALAAWASDGREAQNITDEVFDRIVCALRRDARFGNIPAAEFELLFADAARDLEAELFGALRGHVHLDDAGIVLNRLLGEDY